MSKSKNSLPNGRAKSNKNGKLSVQAPQAAQSASRQMSQRAASAPTRSERGDHRQMSSSRSTESESK